jgi:2-hydroxy-3-oxopropionate reductase
MWISWRLHETTGDDMEIGFCGPGLMGAPMIRRLLSAGHVVHVWARSPDRAQPLVAAGAILSRSPADLADAADAVLLCLADLAAVEAVVFGPNGIVHASRFAMPSAGSGALGASPPRSLRWLADHSSIPPAATRELAQRFHAATGSAWLDAPVSGGVPGAEAGTLAVMAGGAAEAVAAATPVMRAYAARVTHMGESGAGQATKLCNQTIVASTLTAIAEAVGLAGACGVDARRLTEALAGGWADSTLLQLFVPRMTQRGGPTIGALRTLAKDVDAVTELARQSGAPTPLADVVQRLLAEAKSAGLGDADFAALIDVLPLAGRGAAS